MVRRRAVVGKLSEAWSRWWRQDEAGGRWPRLPEGQARLTRYLVLLIGLGVILMSLKSPGGGDGESSLGTHGGLGDYVPAAAPAVPAMAPASSGYARELEAVVRDALLQLHGVNRVHVSVTVAAGPELVLAEQVSRERRVSEEPRAQDSPAARTVIEERHSSQPVILRRDQGRQEEALVVLERMPPIQGVVVVADGAADGRIRREIMRAVSTLLGVPAHRVYVLAQDP